MVKTLDDKKVTPLSQKEVQIWLYSREGLKTWTLESNRSGFRSPLDPMCPCSNASPSLQGGVHNLTCLSRKWKVEHGGCSTWWVIFLNRLWGNGEEREWFWTGEWSLISATASHCQSHCCGPQIHPAYQFGTKETSVFITRVPGLADGGGGDGGWLPWTLVVHKGQGKDAQSLAWCIICSIFLSLFRKLAC